MIPLIALRRHLPVYATLALLGCGPRDVPATCLDDEFEPNHSLETASVLTSPADLSDLFLCVGDRDWYALDAEAGQIIDVALTFAQADGDLDLELYTAGYGLLAASISNADGEALRYVVPADGSYFVHVFGRDGGSTNVYALSAEVSGEACDADSLEPNDSSVQPSTLAEGDTGDLTMCAFEEDWYRISAVQGQVINVRADFDPAQADLALALYSTDPLTEIASSDSTNDVEGIVHRVATSGDYLLRVTDSPNDPRADYSLDLELSGDACIVDDTEPNDSYNSATLVTESTLFDDQHLCFGDQDWYTLDLQNGQALQASLTFAGDESDLALYLYQVNADGTLVGRANSDTVGGEETISFRAFQDASYVLYVTGSRGTLSGDYALDVDISGDACITDKYEANDVYNDATPVSPGPYSALSLCVGDTDYYQFSAKSGQVIDFALDYDAESTDLGLTLYQLTDDGTLTTRVAQDLLGDTEDIVYRPFEDGEFVAYVYRSRGTNVASYSFDLSVSGEVCVADAFEPNDAAPSAVPLPTGSSRSATLCVADGDWYTVSAAAGQLIDVLVAFDQTKADLGVQIYKQNDDGTVTNRAGTDVLNSDEQLIYQPFDSGTFLIYVYRSRGTDIAAYDITAKITGSVCTDDSFEPNNLPAAPNVITPGVYNGLSLCVSDADYYQLDAKNGQLIDVTADIAQETTDDIALTLYKKNSDGTLSGRAAVDALGSDERLTYRPYETGAFVLAATRSRGTVTAQYKLDYKLLGTGCVDDAQEPNNSAFEAKLIGDGAYPNRSLCVGDADYYLLNLKNGQTLDVDVLFSQASADLGVTLYRRFTDGTLAVRASSDDLTDNENILYTPYEDGEFVLYVYRSRGTEVATYNMDVDITGVECVDDVEEPNDSLIEAKPIALAGPADNRRATLTNRHICVSDVDYYSFTAGNNQIILSDLKFVHTESDLAETLYQKNADGTYTARASSNTLTDQEFLSYQTTSAGTYILGISRAQAGSKVGPAYNLALSVTGRECLNDVYEPNDHWLSARTLPLGAVNNTSMCISDDDYYFLFTPTSAQVGKSITVTAGFDADDTDIALRLYSLETDNTVTQKAAADVVGFPENLVYTMQASDVGKKLLLRMNRSRTPPNTGFYTLRVDVQP